MNRLFEVWIGLACIALVVVAVGLLMEVAGYKNKGSDVSGIGVLSTIFLLISGIAVIGVSLICGFIRI